MGTGSKEKREERYQHLLDEYQILVRDLHHLHNVQHGLMQYTMPIVAAAVGLSANIEKIMFTAVLVVLSIFVVGVWLFYERLDYLIALKFVRLVEIEEQTDFHCYQHVRRPPPSLSHKYKWGQRTSMFRLYRISSMLTLAVLLILIIIMWIQ